MINGTPQEMGYRASASSPSSQCSQALTTAGADAQQQSALALPRNATLYTSGTAWGPFTQFNPLRSSGNATGTLGLLYETLFRYDPLKDKYIPWLATSGKWVGRTYVIHLRATA